LKTIMYWYWLKLKGACTSKNIDKNPTGAPPAPKPGGFGVT